MTFRKKTAAILKRKWNKLFQKFLLSLCKVPSLLFASNPFNVICRNFVSFRFKEHSRPCALKFTHVKVTHNKIPPYELFFKWDDFYTTSEDNQEPVCFGQNARNSYTRTNCLLQFLILIYRSTFTGCNEQRFKPPKFSSFIYHCTKMKQKSLNVSRWFAWVGDNLMGIVREFPDCVSFRNTKHVRGVPLGALPPPANITI